MKLDKIEDINKWFKESELVEFEYKKGDFKVSLTKGGERNNSTKIVSTLTSVQSPEIGIFSFTKKGKSVSIKEGDKVKKGDILGYVNICDKSVEVVSPVDGRIKIICVDDGAIVEYSQLLFVIE